MVPFINYIGNYDWLYMQLARAVNDGMADRRGA